MRKTSFFVLLLSVVAVQAPAQGVITTIAGGQPFVLDDGPALDSPLGRIDAIAVGPGGSIYASDVSQSALVLISPQGDLTVEEHRDVPLYGPLMATDDAGVLFFVDDNSIRRREADGSTAVVVTAPELSQASDLAIDAQGNFYISSVSAAGVLRITRAGVVTRIAGDGTCGFAGDGDSAIAAKLCNPYALAVDGDGNIFIMDGGNSRVRRVDTTGTITTIAGNGQRGDGTGIGDGGSALDAHIGLTQELVVDGNGDLYFPERNRVRRFKVGGDITTIAGGNEENFLGDGGPATKASLREPRGLAIDADGALLIADTGNWRIRRVANGTITTIAGNGAFGSAGDGGPATEASIVTPYGLAFDPRGDLYFSDINAHRVRKIDRAGTITAVAGNGPGYGGDGGPAVDAMLSSPADLAFDAVGNLYIADSGNGRIRRVDGNGIIDTVAGGGPDSATQDGILATQANLHFPSGVSVDADGHLYIAEDGRNCAGKVRKVALDGTISTLTNNYCQSTGHVTATPDGIYFSVAALSFGRRDGHVSRINLDGSLTNVGDRLLRPGAIVLDDSGNVVVTDSFEGAVIRMDSLGTQSIVAGMPPMNGFSGDGGPATSALLSAPSGLAMDTMGDLYIADTGNSRIRRVTPCPFSLPGSNTSIGASAGIGGFDVDAPDGCSWAAGTDADWITLATKSGTGNAPVFYSVTENAAPTARSATIRVSDQSFIVNQSGAAVSSGGTFEPALVKRLTPGYYIVEATLAERASGGYWGLEVLASRGSLGGGFNLGGGLSGNAVNPGFGAFHLSKSQTVTASVASLLAPNADLTLRLLNAKREVLDQVEFGESNFSRSLDPGFYIVEVESHMPAPIAYSLVLAAEVFSGADTGGYIGPGIVGFRAFYVPEEQDVTIRMFGKNTYGPAGAESLVLTLKDAQRRVLEVVEP